MRRSAVFVKRLSLSSPSCAEIGLNALNQLSLYLVGECSPSSGDMLGLRAMPPSGYIQHGGRCSCLDSQPHRSLVQCHLVLTIGSFNCVLIRSEKTHLFQFILYRNEGIRENAEGCVDSCVRFSGSEISATLCHMTHARIFFPWSLTF